MITSLKNRYLYKSFIYKRGSYHSQRGGKRFPEREALNSEDDYYEIARRGVDQSEAMKVSRGRGRTRPSKKPHNDRRIQNYRKEQSTITVNDFGAELRKSLYPRVKTVKVLRKAITLTVTTRLLGFSCVSTFIALFEFNNVPIRGSFL